VVFWWLLRALATTGAGIPRTCWRIADTRSVRGGVHVAPAADPLQEKLRGWGGDWGRRLAEVKENLVAVAGHVLDREADDAAEGLGVEQDDGGRSADLERQVRVR
jgi:hypothetical protein